jgi:WD40 repeat protein
VNIPFKSFLLFCGAFLLNLSLGQAMPALSQDLVREKGATEPILIITSTSNPIGNYYAKILQNEGLNAFSVSDISTVSPATLASYDVVLLADSSPTSAQVTMLSGWVSSGGNLIAMHPDNKLANLLGVIDTGTPLSNGYLLIDTSKAPGEGLVNQTIQFHGNANRYTLNGASSIATLYTDESTATANPAVTLRSVGSGKAAAFSYDLARSIVYTRLGNAVGDSKPDSIDLNKVAIPQADEQQRLLANLIIEINKTKKPLPRFWYLPRGEKAVVLMTGYERVNGGTASQFEQFKTQSPPGCSVNDWECIRGTSYVFPNTSLTDMQAAGYNTEGFEIGLQLDTGCEDFNPSLLEFFYTQQLTNFSNRFLSLPAPSTQRYVNQLGDFSNSFPSFPAPSTRQQCLVKSDWVTTAKVGLNKGIRFNTTSYRPSSLLFDRPGFFTGSGMPMPLADLDGTLFDVYQANTQITDEREPSPSSNLDPLMDKALGAEGFYGVFTVSASTNSVSDAVVTSAKSRGVPVVSARQMLTWLDGRNSSSFGALFWNNNSLSFTITPGTGANGLQAMLPMQSGNSSLSALTLGGSPVEYTTEEIKGISYALFSGAAGSYVATYTPDTSASAVNAKSSDPIPQTKDETTLEDPAPVLVEAQTSTDPAKASRSKATSLSFSADGKTLATGWSDSQILLLDKETGRQKLILKHGRESALPVIGMTFVPNSDTLISAGGDSTINLWNTVTGERSKILFGHETPLRTVAVSSDGNLLASGDSDALIGLWNVESGIRLRFLEEKARFVNSVAFSPDGKTLASGTDKNQIIFWDVKTGKQRQMLQGHKGGVTSVVFSPDGRTLASAGQDKTVRLWDVASGKELQILSGNTKRVRVIAFSPDGATLAGGGDDKKTFLWNVTTGKLRKTISGNDSVIAVAFNPQNTNILAVAESNRVVLYDNIAKGQTNKVIQAPVSSSPPDSSSLARAAASPLNQAVATALPTPPGGPILVITSASNPFGNYYDEILRNEGLNAFSVSDISTVSSATLASYDVVVLADMPLTPAQVTILSDWVNSGGNLIAMRPDNKLASLLGLIDTGTLLSNGYLLVDTSKAPGDGLVNQTIQFHGDANRYTLNGASSLATLYTDASTATASPAVTLRSVGAGKAAAFSYDLARSIVYTRQGNPVWAGQERDNADQIEFNAVNRIRSDDLFFGAASFDPQPDWVNLTKVAIPQADEQQRLLANLILEINKAKKPLPRFWYLPRGKKAVVLMTGDDHGNSIDNTASRFEQFKTQSPPGCSVNNWECIRGTSYVFLNTSLTDMQAAGYNTEGFEVALHVDTGCANFTPTSLDPQYTQQLSQFSTNYPSLPAPVTQRHHCLVWSDWSTTPKVEFSKGIRLDTTYYYWPGFWVADRPGFFTGSGMPMRLADLDGTVLDVYQANTQMTDESRQSYPFTVDTLLDRALGPEGFYGVFNVNAHTDRATSAVSDPVVASAKARGVPVVSARQMLTWLDGRNSSSFSSLVWSNNSLSFTITPGNGANGLQAMLPLQSGNLSLNSLTLGGNLVTFTQERIKGINYALFAGNAGSYVATYTSDTTAPTVSSTTPSNGVTNVALTSTMTATFSEAMDPATISTSTFELRNPANTLVTATVSYDAASKTATLTPSSALTASTTYTATVKGGTTDPRVKDLAGNALAANVSWSFTTTTGAAPCSQQPCSIWPSTAAPTNPSNSDTAAVELGVKFRSDVNGFITGIRFYKGSGNTGTHVGSLWSISGGTPLATATFSGETASGWQQVTFATPVAITAGTTYVASYHAPVGRYAADNNFFATAGVDNAPLSALSNAVSAGNGVYRYSATPAFPDSTFQSTNYWVDVVFTTTTAPDTTAPTVSSTTPSNGATDVTPGTTVKATFSEAMDPATISTSTFELRNPANTLVTATVSYDAASKTATLTPSSALTASTTYTATVKGGTTDPRVKDLAGNALAANVSWSFTTTTGAAPCSQQPCSIWPSTAVPTNPSNSDTAAVELGVKFRSDVNGFITGIRFYKGSGNTGTHVGSLWSISGGTPLATATFSGETASGWQQVTFATPVAITAGTTYVASYHAPVGRYAADNNFFATAGVDNAPLSALSNAVSAGNGVYRYSATPAFPDFTFQSTNYWVDVVFTTTIAPDTTAPTVSSTTPTSSATNVALTSTVTATFSEAMDPATISGTTFVLRNSTGTQVTAAVSYNPTTQVATLTPSTALAGSTTYTATVTGGSSGVKDSAGNALVADRTWSFATAAVDVTPPTVTARSPGIGALGVSQTANVTVTFSEAMDATTISASTFELRDSLGTLVSSVVSYDATSRVATLNPTPTLNANAVYTATVKGGASGVKDSAGNPLAADVSWSFTTVADTTPPTVSAISPAAGTTTVSPTANVTATFSEVMDATTISASTFELRDPSGAVVPAVVTYNTSNRVATLNPTPNLSAGLVYTATVRGGLTDPRVKDSAGNALAVNRVWTFTIETTPPIVTTTSPANGATGFSRTANITATFNEAMDAATVSASTFELRDPSGAVVPAVVTYNTSSRVATLNPTPTLTAATTYTVIVKGGATDPRVKDVAGNGLAASQVWSFTTQ